MELLREMLDKAGVEYLTSDGYFGPASWRTFSDDFETDDDGGCVAGFSCILHVGSYGHDVGLLELWAKGMEEPVGWLSAGNVMYKLRKAGLA
jgi:hypothetical protein